MDIRKMDIRKMHRKTKKSFRCAVEGLKAAVKSERNMRFHLLAMILVIIAGFSFKISLTEWAICLLLIGGVISSELLNTAIEKTVDVVMPYKHEKAKVIKDMAAGGVLVWAIAAAIVGGIIFLPKIISLF